ncbi:MAG: hypothetical protein ACRYFS_15590 [Janthinobacterium lividum]
MNYALPVKHFFVRYRLAALGVAICAVAICGTAIYGRLERKVKSADMLAGKWVGMVVWHDASGRSYRQTMRTALFFLPGNVVGIVITFPTGAIGGAGHYTLRDSHLIVHCDSLTINGRTLPMTDWKHAPWFHESAAYVVTSNGEHLTLTPSAAPTPAPCFPLLVSPKPIVLSRIDHAEKAAPAPPPRE